MKTLLISLLPILLIFSTSCSRANVAGKWTGQFKAADSSHVEPAFLVLTQAGSTLTGTAGPNANEQWPIQNGKVDGDNVTFDVTSNAPVTIHFSLKFIDKHLKGEAKGQQGKETHTATVDLTRAD